MPAPSRGAVITGSLAAALLGGVITVLIGSGETEAVDTTPAATAAPTTTVRSGPVGSAPPTGTVPPTLLPPTATAPPTSIPSSTTPVPAAAPPPTTDANGCGTDLSAAAVADAVGTQAGPRGGGEWDVVGGNFNRCSALSAALITSTGSGAAPVTQVLLFHDGAYLGTGSNRQIPFTAVDSTLSTPETVVLGYTSPSCPRCTENTSASLRLTWDGSRAVLQN